MPTDKNKLLKQLLQQAIDSGDPELIQIAQAALKKSKNKTPAKRGRPSKIKPDEIPASKRQNGVASFEGNLFNPLDYADQFKDDAELDKKVKFRKSERREAIDDIELTCSRCSRREYAPGSYASFISERKYYICNKCGATK